MQRAGSSGPSVVALSVEKLVVPLETAIALAQLSLASASGIRSTRIDDGEPGLNRPISAWVTSCGGASATKRKLYSVPQRSALAS